MSETAVSADRQTWWSWLKAESRHERAERRHPLVTTVDPSPCRRLDNRMAHRRPLRDRPIPDRLRKTGDVMALPTKRQVAKVLGIRQREVTRIIRVAVNPAHMVDVYNTSTGTTRLYFDPIHRRWA